MAQCESARLPPLWPGFKYRRRRHSGLSLFLVLSQVDEEPLFGCATSKSLYVVLFYFFIYNCRTCFSEKNKQTTTKTTKKKTPMGNKRLFDLDNLIPNFPFFSFYAFRAYTVNP